MSAKASIVITGDVHLGGGRVTGLARQNKAGALFGDFLTLFQSADLAVTNLESPLTDRGAPLPKSGPNLKSHPDTVQVLKEAGFGLVTLANNHILDYGEVGLEDTLIACKNAGIHTVGAGMDSVDAKKPFMTEINGISVVILNIAENEFGTSQNGEPGGHGMDPVENFYAIQRAKESADHVIVIVHGGHEHYELPSPRMKNTYRFYADAGASAVIAHHTHCPCGYEVYNGAPVCYSLGNFLFDIPGKNGTDLTPWHEGLIAELSVTREAVEVSYTPYIQNFESAGLRRMNNGERTEFDKKIDRLNSIISDDERLASEFKAYCSRSRQMYSGFIEPHSSRLLHALRNRNLAPSLLSDNKKRLLLNLTRCESHRDVLIKTLTS